MKVLKRKGLLKTHTVEEVKEEPKKSKKTKGNSLPSDEYKDELTPKEIVLSEDGKIVVSVKRGGLDGLPRVDIRFFATTEVYTGFTKKGINFDLEYLPDLLEILSIVSDEADEKGLFEDFE